ncbi:ubiquitin-protein ligase E3C-like [Dendronephthya gigantea]|uniref:ubiquitin-protein ligase E3C-like n=1 Tax=Dendronephthya gigantea TaxID=151771 RepID=UPI00106B0537|nr:ubiquitin-protein ligase E3C-like [Dendronephthya gigantea]
MFGGEYKSKPKVSLRGASKKEKRSSLIHRNQTERERREENRRRNYSALKIQAFFRGNWIRKQECDARRKEFDEILAQLEGSEHPHIDNIHLLLSCLLYFYSRHQDTERLISTSQFLLKNNKRIKINDHRRWTFQIKKFLCLCSSILRELIKTKKRSFAIPLRILESFTSPAWYSEMSRGIYNEEYATTIFLCLAENDYFSHLRYVLEERVPSSIEYGSSTPLADSLVDLLTKPLRQICNSSQENQRFKLLSSFAEAVFVPKLSNQVKNYLLPKLQDQGDFPFKDLLQCLQNTQFTSTVSLLYCILKLAQSNIETLETSDIPLYLETILKLLRKLPPKVERSEKEEEIEDSDDEASTSSQMQQDLHEKDDDEVIEDCFEMLNEKRHVKLLLDTFDSRSQADVKFSEDCIRLLTLIVNSLIFERKCHIHKSRILLTLSSNRTFFTKLWNIINHVSIQSSIGKRLSLLQMVNHGSNLRNWEAECIAPLLAVFCFLLGNLLFSLHDIDFRSHDSGAKIPFSFEQLSEMGRMLCDTTLGVIEIMNHEIRTTTVPNYNLRSKIAKVRLGESLRENEMYSKDKWNNVLEAMTRVIKQLHSRDTRLHYCPIDHWLSSKVDLQVELIDLEIFFQEKGTVNPSDYLHGTPGKTFLHVAILEHIPFVVPFVDRVKLFQRILNEDKVRHAGNLHGFLMGPEVRIRRATLYQDAFDELSGDQDLKQRIHVKLFNLQGLEEAGVDGGGLFREFLNECLKAGFDQNIGFFSSTRNELLYPNPQGHLVDQNVFTHYYFLGKMLGKAIYENMLVELPFASFFLCKVLSQTNADVDINHLESLDPDMYRNLLYLKDCPDVEDLDLNFTVINDNLGHSEVVELKPGGRDIVVTNQNRIEYIHLMADYKLNRQIRPHCNAFRSGLSTVIDISWLRMFDPNELQMLISGAQVPIDIEDLKSHTSYSGGFSEDHICMKYFWSIVSQFSDDQMRQLLKFVTSCSRPPLLGFKDLYPPFTIHTAGSEDRLPSASTCVNLLKLPEYPDLETMRQRLLYSIESGAGFELS